MDPAAQVPREPIRGALDDINDCPMGYVAASGVKADISQRFQDKGEIYE